MRVKLNWAPTSNKISSRSECISESKAAASKRNSATGRWFTFGVSILFTGARARACVCVDNESLHWFQWSKTYGSGRSASGILMSCGPKHPGRRQEKMKNSNRNVSNTWTIKLMFVNEVGSRHVITLFTKISHSNWNWPANAFYRPGKLIYFFCNFEATRLCFYNKKNSDLLLWWLQLRVMANSNEAPFDKIGNLENYSRQTRHRMGSDPKDKRSSVKRSIEWYKNIIHKLNSKQSN